MRLTQPSTGDIVAGVSVALVALPQSLAYAELAGMPPQYGLFASALPSLLAALFVSSRYLQTGPVALTALLTFGALEGLAQPASAQYIEMAALLALLVGILRVVLGFIRLGSVAYLLSEPVLAGFTTGAAILIVSSQIPRSLGVDRDCFDRYSDDGYDWDYGVSDVGLKCYMNDVQAAIALAQNRVPLQNEQSTTTQSTRNGVTVASVLRTLLLRVSRSQLSTGPPRFMNRKICCP